MARPPNPAPVARKSIAIPVYLWDAIADYRFAERIPSEAEAVRRVIRAGIHAILNEPGGKL